MCGIIAILRRRSRRAAPTAEQVRIDLRRATEPSLDPNADDVHDQLEQSSSALERANTALFGPPGIATLATEPDLATEIRATIEDIVARIDRCEAGLDANPGGREHTELERVNAAVIRLRDAAWAVAHDRLDTADAVLALVGEDRAPAAIEACFSIQSALSALDRLEVRGRDSAGLYVLVHNHGLDLTEPTTRNAFELRATDPTFRSRSVRDHSQQTVGFVYKRAAEIGELGDNVAALRAAIAADELLHAAIRGQDAAIQVLGHTRWASIGIISESNAHPLESAELSASDTDPFVVSVLNGDVDNHAALVSQHHLELAPEITTDAKVIPSLVSHRLAEGTSLADAFRATVQAFEGSVAIGTTAAATPDLQAFALRGSGQALYVGIAEDTFVVASEPYGVTELTDRYLRMDGETPGNPANPTASRGQIVLLARAAAGTLEGITRIAYDGTALPVHSTDLKTAPVTTRDVHRGPYPHFLLKEITEAPNSFRKTLRGKVCERDGRLVTMLGDDTLPPLLRARLRKGEIRKIVVIGQGTAAVAGQGVLAAIRIALGESSPFATYATPATELSGFQMRRDMSDTLVIAISQSGTTTDTNRTVDLVRNRGCFVIAIVNRRGSDLTDKADGVLYTSDGRDVEMSVASTKAFYAQIAAGFLLAFALAEELDCEDRDLEHDILLAMRAIPDAMTQVLAKRDEVRLAATGFATKRRYWAVVGNGNNRIAAQEIRIKLSELCYKSIACDATEDKKHIDLSAEPMILICAAGLRGSTADDVAKEVAIYRAHQSAPIVIASEGEERFSAACRTITVPAVHPALDFILSAVVGHLFGYEAALAIDALATPMREARAAIEQAARTAIDGESLLEELAPELVGSYETICQTLRQGTFDGQLEASTATLLVSLLRYATGVAPLETFQIEHGKVGTPAVVIDALTEALTDGIEQLTRPVDAIKHQAKTVTVGISRSDESLMNEPLVQAVLEAGAPRDSIAYGELRALAALSPLVDSVQGFSRYSVAIHADGTGAIEQIDSGGVAANLSSRTHDNPALKGTKHQVARERNLLVACGQSDGRSVLIVPETLGTRTTGITLLHLQFCDRAPANVLRSALESYRERWLRLEETVTETEAALHSDVLEDLAVLDCLTMPVTELAAMCRRAKAAE